MRYRRIVYGLLASAIAQTAHAQIDPEQMLQGPPQRAFATTLKAEVQHETNIARASKALALAQNIEPSDTYVEPALNMNIVQPLGQQMLFLNGSASYLFHDKNQNLNAARANLVGGVGGVLGPCGTVLSASYHQGRTRVDDTALSTSIRNISKVVSGNAALTCARPNGLGLFFLGGIDSVRNSIANQTNGDAETARGSAGLRYGRPTFGTISLIATYSDTDYRNQPLGFQGSGGFITRGAGVEFERRLGARIQAAVGVAYTEAEVKGAQPAAFGSFGDFKGLTYSGDIKFRASSRLDAELGFERAVRPTQVIGGSHEIAASVDVAMNYKVGSRILVTLSAAQRKARQEGSALATALAIQSARSRVGGVALRYKLNQHIALSLTGQHERHETNKPLFDYRNNIVALSAMLTY